jgi:hypothetical protein
MLRIVPLLALLLDIARAPIADAHQWVVTT